MKYLFRVVPFPVYICICYHKIMFHALVDMNCVWQNAPLWCLLLVFFSGNVDTKLRTGSTVLRSNIFSAATSDLNSKFQDRIDTSSIILIFDINFRRWLKKEVEIWLQVPVVFTRVYRDCHHDCRVPVFAAAFFNRYTYNVCWCNDVYMAVYVICCT